MPQACVLLITELLLGDVQDAHLAFIVHSLMRPAQSPADAPTLPGSKATAVNADG